MGSSDVLPGDTMPRLYGDLAEWSPLLTPVEDYVEEAAFYRRLFEAHAARPLRASRTRSAVADDIRAPARRVHDRLDSYA